MPIDPREFLDDAAELHALTIGFAEVFCPWPSRYHASDLRTDHDIANEYHYYQFGRALGLLALLGLAYLIKMAFC
jgi:hypothetical protein